MAALEAALTPLKQAIASEIADQVSSFQLHNATTSRIAGDEGAVRELQDEVKALKAKSSELTAEVASLREALSKVSSAQTTAVPSVESFTGPGPCTAVAAAFSCLNFVGRWQAERAAQEAAALAEAKAAAKEQAAEICSAVAKRVFTNIDHAVPMTEWADSLSVTTFRGEVAGKLGIKAEELDKIDVSNKTLKEISAEIAEVAASHATAATKDANDDTITGQKDAEDASKAGDTAAADTAPSQVVKLTKGEFLAEAGFMHLEDALTNWDGLLAALGNGRVPTMNFLKDAGVDKLPERQKVASALAKARRERRI